MRQKTSSFLTAVALLIVLWLIWRRVYIVVHVSMPWWGFLLFAVGLFLVIDYLLERIFNR